MAHEGTHHDDDYGAGLRISPDFGLCQRRGRQPGGSDPGSRARQPGPTFSYPGDRQCKITYRDNGNGAMSWTATVTLAGELITHASDTSGETNRHDVQVPAGQTTFGVAEPLSQIDDVGGVLHVGSKSYGCSIAPQSASGQ